VVSSPASYSGVPVLDPKLAWRQSVLTVLLWLLESLRANKCWDITNSIHILSTTLVINHPIIPPSIDLATDSVVKCMSK
jgi:hypothetical protein